MISFKLAINNLKRFFKERNTVFIYIILPVLILAAVVMFLNLDSKISVMVADEADSLLTDRYIEYLKGNKQLSIKEVTIVDDENEIDNEEQYTEEYIQDLIKNLNLSTFIKIPKDFDEKFFNLQEVNIEAYALNESQAQLTITNLNNNFFTNVRALYIGSGRDIDKFNELLEEFNKSQPIAISQYTGESEDPSSLTFALGILIYFILLASFKICKFAVEDKTSRVYYRIFTMPVTPKHYILGYIISTFFIVLVQIILNILVMSILTEGNIPILETVITLSIFSICSIAISMLIIAVVNKESTIEIFTSGVVMFTSMLSGVFWPIDIMPDFMRNLALLFPQYWALDLIKYLFFGGSILDKQQNLIILAATFVVFFIAAVYFMRMNDDIRDAN